MLDDRLRAGRQREPVVAGRTIRAVMRIGKRVAIEFSPRESRPTGDALWLGVHLRMTGRLIWLPAPARAPRRHLRARFALDGGALLFIDTRRFGTFDWAAEREALEPHGIDPLSAALDARRLRELLGDSSQPIKTWLLRQDRLVGLGNIYASEILHRARIAPLRPAGGLDAAERARLLRSTRAILRRAIDNCGTTFSDFQDASGDEGAYQQYLAVYDRGGERCPRCAGQIRREVQAQRSTYWCAECQD